MSVRLSHECSLLICLMNENCLFCLYISIFHVRINVTKLKELMIRVIHSGQWLKLIMGSQPETITQILHLQ